MPTVTLLEKVYGSFSPETFEHVFSSLCKGLKVKLRVVGETNRGWVQIEVSGEDEIAALHFLDREIGLAPVSPDKLKKFSVVIACHKNSHTVGPAMLISIRCRSVGHVTIIVTLLDTFFLILFLSMSRQRSVSQ